MDFCCLTVEVCMPAPGRNFNVPGSALGCCQLALTSAACQ